ncbi:TPA: signal recognition particle-docking protein FtsY [Pseudomonas putida]|uniref:Signal recognition particle receptor FtsY n=1 Tax=Pseudomonas putida (strain GB-1) TaxID=76869 RepID=B0KN65_PSEPG|nr:MULTISPECIES: signal recognition particle-docking protein FtsY [Pseudomonas]ABZ01046.1 signal recognition particle-docking protein FtsY [Pseudomonas putida GB-1]APF01147.1 signal recognition particle-docking protein FtsY [Pseudomonas putida]MBP0711128.1 signal recognition particle-docking protein FtsY [Pseudomonas sp. T34]MCE1002398.1 signal recognition particle-docking protein FtsY [Pseudomonas sp. NMI1173_11]MCK2190579.1 signal recognition particle-docking protein FtsY [Pseudomonas sp. MB
MFGSNDDKKAPAEAGEKKGLFSWFRKKPQQPVAEQPQAPEPQAAEPVAPQPAVERPEAAPMEPVAAQAPAPATEAPRAAEPALAPEPANAPVVAPVLESAPAPVVASAPEPALSPVDAGLPASAQSAAPQVETPAPVAVPATQIIEPPVSNLVLPVAEEPVALVPDLEPKAPPAIPERPVAEPVQPEPEPAPVAAATVTEQAKPGFFARLKQGLSKTSASIGEGMASLFLGKKVIDDDLLDEIETRLLTADVGVEATSAIVQNLTQKVARKQLADADALYKSLQEELAALLRPVEQPLKVQAQNKPYVILVVGVNGAGKTTTIGKLAKKLQLDGKKVMLAAGDTFRAAAVEQLQVWGERNQIPVIAQHTGADSASVIFDAVQAAKARGVDVLIADTAGRLHTKDNLMEELKKVRRVIGKLDAEAPHEVLLVLDAGTGQNAISQAKYFNQSVELTGLALTKLDGTAKGGVIFALAKQFNIPIRFIGVGEGIDDLRTFEAEPFVKALFAERD